MVDDAQERLRDALKRVAVALKEGEVPFAVVGGYALWARGGPEPDHDADVMVAAGDVARAGEVLADAGLKVVQPPEDWLFKVFVDDAMVDVIFRDAGEPATAEAVLDADAMEVLSVEMPVLSATRIVVQRLSAMDEHLCDFAAQLPVARALREQVDWAEVRRRVAGQPFAESFLFLVERLGIVAPEGTGGGAA